MEAHSLGSGSGSSRLAVPGARPSASSLSGSCGRHHPPLGGSAVIQELKIISQSGRVCAVGYWAEGDAEAARCLCISAGGENQQVEGGREGGERQSGRLGRARERERERG